MSVFAPPIRVVGPGGEERASTDHSTLFAHPVWSLPVWSLDCLIVRLVIPRAPCACCSLSGRSACGRWCVASQDCSSPEIQGLALPPGRDRGGFGHVQGRGYGPLAPARGYLPLHTGRPRTPVGVIYESCALLALSGDFRAWMVIDPGRYRRLASGPELSVQATRVRRPSSWCQPRGAPFPRFRGARGLCSA